MKTRKPLHLVLSLVLVAAMMLSMSVTAFAGGIAAPTTSITDEVATKIKNANTLSSTHDDTKINTLYAVGEANLTANDVVTVNGVDCYVLSVNTWNNTAQLITKEIYNQSFNASGSGYDYATSDLKTYMENFYTNQLGRDSRIIVSDVYSYTCDSDSLVLSTFTATKLEGSNYVYALDAVEATTNESKFGSYSLFEGFWVSAGYNDNGYANALCVLSDNGVYVMLVDQDVIGARPAFTIDLTVTEANLDLEISTADIPVSHDITQKYIKTTATTDNYHHQIAFSWTNQIMQVGIESGYKWKPSTLSWDADSTHGGNGTASILNNTNVSTFTFRNYSVVPFKGGVTDFTPASGVDSNLQSTFSATDEITLTAVETGADGVALEQYFTDSTKNTIKTDALPSGTVTATLNPTVTAFNNMSTMSSAADYGVFTISFTRK